MASRYFKSYDQWSRYWEAKEHPERPELWAPELRDIDIQAETEDRRRAEKREKEKQRDLARRQKDEERRYHKQLDKRIEQIEKKKKYTFWHGKK